MIRTRHLRKEFEGKVAIENLDLVVNRGDVFGLIGPNGAGKTTLLRILATLEKPTYGSVEIAGIDVLSTPKACHRRLGFMPDFHHTYEEMTVGQYLGYFAAAYRLSPADCKKRIAHVLAFLQLEGKIEETIGTLSRGMKQRLCLARVLIHDPEVLLLDEPTSGLDPRARLDFREVVKRLAAEGKTLVISSHILEDLSDFCNAVGILERGRLVQSGRIADILARMKMVTRLRVKVVAGVEKAAAILKDAAGVVSVLVDGSTIEVGFRGDLAAQAGLLAAVVGAGVQVAAFEEKRAGLQEIFLAGSHHEVA